jgi:hypothetical protein
VPDQPLDRTQIVALLQEAARELGRRSAARPLTVA